MDVCQGGIGAAGEVHTGLCLGLRRSHVELSGLMTRASLLVKDHDYKNTGTSVNKTLPPR